jgi:hypothetical protein
MEYARGADGLATKTPYDAVDEAAQADFDGDFWTLVGGGGKSHWKESGVVEADCLMCHLQGYTKSKFGARTKQLTYRNYKWANSVALGTVTGKVYTFDETTASGFMNGTFNVAADGTLTDPPSVTYDPTLFEGGQLKGSLIAKRPTIAQPGDIYCLFCHESSDTKKRGFEWSAEHDVHAGKVHCLVCHGMYDEDGDGKFLEHQIGKGFARLGSVRNDLDGTMAWDCQGCHLGGVGPNPGDAHQAAFGDAAFHVSRLACEACHIPSIDWAEGYLIDMSSGKQIWTLSDGTTPTWADEFQKPSTFKPFWKKYDPDGAGPRPEKYYPFGAKSSAWFGRVADTGEIQPLFLRHVSAAYEAIKGTLQRPGVPVRTVPFDLDPASPAGTFDATRPSVSADADVMAMINRLEADHPEFGRVVFVTNVVKGIEGGALAVLTDFDAESCHDFSINHDTRPAAQALGANGCTDCHAPAADGGPLYNPQVRQVTQYLADRTAPVDQSLLDDPAYSESMATFAGFDAGQTDRLLRDIVDPTDPADVHPSVVTYGEGGANTCAKCHAAAVSDFKQTTHYTSRSAVGNPNFFFPGGGKHGMLDRACALVGSNMLLNMLTTSYVDEGTAAEQGGQPAQQCGSCHTNYYNTLLEGFVAMQAGPEAADQLMRSGVDCLVCHAEQYDFNLRTTYEPDPTGLNMGFGTIAGVPQRIRQDRSAAAVDSIRRTPTDDMCLRCHEHARTDYKRGELPEAEYDIHYQLGISSENPCLYCHEATDHKFNRGPMVNGDIFASDYPVNSEENGVACTNCHTSAPHDNPQLNDHVAKVACETCHITYTAGAETTIWADGGFLALAKTGGQPRKLYTQKEGNQGLTPEQLWEAYKTRPIYMPFSGLTSFLAQSIPLPNPGLLDQDGQPTQPRIFPFKTIINPMPFDGRFFGIGLPEGQSPMGPDGVNLYSMFAAMRMFADQYKALGFMDADFDFAAFQVDAQTGMMTTTVPATDPTYPSYAAMAQMAQFPNLLFFDKYTFGYNWYQNLQTLADQGKITTWDEDGPAARPLAAKDMRKAVAVGMSRLLDMMLQMGFDPGVYGMTAEQMKGMYANLTEDQLVVMAAPPGSEMQAMLQQMGYDNWANYPAYSNGVTLGGHGVQKDTALSCTDCHAPGGIFDQSVEVPTYGVNGMPLFHWEFFSKELLAKAESGEIVDNVEDAGYLLKGGDFEMGVTFEPASQAAAGLGITFGLTGDYLAVLTPTNRLATNWAVLGYSDERRAELVGEASGGGGGPSGSGSDSSSGWCFLQSLGAASGGLAPLSLTAAALALVGLRKRR